ncbi:expressed unknown protein [Seminavis robusta]|uniref:Uncharacterized protein n=1 Tax=Seminavis robusta TaxID=568900 RepID=A0A9N8HA16_9STRA|nr:expressed unknown protein [Seminavis robusta]|eukprot:Sro275_g105820.1 n/a (374) ;mRNA; f:63291-64720
MKSSPVEQVEGERSSDKEFERSDEAKMVGEVDVDEIAAAVARAHEVSRMSKPLALSKDLQITAAMLSNERQQEEGRQSVPVQQYQSLKDVTPLPQPMPLSESDDLPSLAIVSGVERSHPELRMMSKNAALRQDLQLSPAEMMTRNTRDLDKRRPVHSYQSLKDIIPLPQPMPLETRARSPPPTLPAEVSPGAYNIVGVRPIGAYHFSRPTAPPTRTSSATPDQNNHEGLVEATQVQDHLPTGHAVLENAKTRPPSPPKRLLGYSMLASMVLAVVLLALIVTLATDNYTQNQEMKRAASSHNNNGTIANNGNVTSSSNATSQVHLQRQGRIYRHTSCRGCQRGISSRQCGGTTRTLVLDIAAALYLAEQWNHQR